MRATPRLRRGLAFGVLAVFGMPLSVNAGGLFQTAEAIDLGAGALTAGGAMLTRTGESVHLRVGLTGLDPNAAYSVWFLIWNSPRTCNTPNDFGGLCSPPGGDAPQAVRHAAGFVTGMDGTANFSAWLDVGAAPRGMAGFGRLKRGRRSEIHVLVQSHGMPANGDVAGQMTMPGFMCNPDCTDQFAFVFPPAGPDQSEP